MKDGENSMTQVTSAQPAGTNLENQLMEWWETRLRQRIEALVGEKTARQWYDIVSERAIDGQVPVDLVLALMADVFEDGMKIHGDSSFQREKQRARADRILTQLKAEGAFATRSDHAGMLCVTIPIADAERFLKHPHHGTPAQDEETDLWFAQQV